LYFYRFDVIMLFYISCPSWSNITLCTMVDRERFSAFRVDHWVQKPGHPCLRGVSITPAYKVNSHYGAGNGKYETVLSIVHVRTGQNIFALLGQQTLARSRRQLLSLVPSLSVIATPDDRRSHNCSWKTEDSFTWWRLVVSRLSCP
jgi:hypothetical protein